MALAPACPSSCPPSCLRFFLGLSLYELCILSCFSLYGSHCVTTPRQPQSTDPPRAHSQNPGVRPSQGTLSKSWVCNPVLSFLPRPPRDFLEMGDYFMARDKGQGQRSLVLGSFTRTERGPSEFGGCGHWKDRESRHRKKGDPVCLDYRGHSQQGYQ